MLRKHRKCQKVKIKTRLSKIYKNKGKTNDQLRNLIQGFVHVRFHVLMAFQANTRLGQYRKLQKFFQIKLGNLLLGGNKKMNLIVFHIRAIKRSISTPFLLSLSSYRWGISTSRVLLGGTEVKSEYALPIFFRTISRITSTCAPERGSSTSGHVSSLRLLDLLVLLLFPYIITHLNQKG